MEPQPNQTVKIFFANSSLQVEGIVFFWSNEKVILKTLDNDSSLIIYNPSSNILMVKIIDQAKKSPSVMTQDLQEKFEQVKESPSNDSLRIKKLADLKILLQEQERKIIAGKLKTHHIDPDKKVSYVSHFGIFQKPISK